MDKHLERTITHFQRIADEEGIRHLIQFSDHQISIRSEEINRTEATFVLVLLLLTPIALIIYQLLSVEIQLELLATGIIGLGIGVWKVYTQLIRNKNLMLIDLDKEAMLLRNDLNLPLPFSNSHQCKLSEINAIDIIDLRSGYRAVNHYRLRILDENGKVLSYMNLSDELESRPVQKALIRLLEALI